MSVWRNAVDFSHMNVLLFSDISTSSQVSDCDGVVLEIYYQHYLPSKRILAITQKIVN